MEFCLYSSRFANTLLSRKPKNSSMLLAEIRRRSFRCTPCSAILAEIPIIFCAVNLLLRSFRSMSAIVDATELLPSSSSIVSVLFKMTTGLSRGLRFLNAVNSVCFAGFFASKSQITLSALFMKLRVVFSCAALIEFNPGQSTSVMFFRRSIGKYRATYSICSRRLLYCALDSEVRFSNSFAL